MLQIYATHGHYFLVNHLSLAHRLDLCGRKAWCEVFAVLRFIKRGEEKIVEGFFPLLDFLFCEARATDLSFILSREFGIALIEMDTLEAVFVFEIKMVVNDNLLSVVVGQELQQSFGIDRLGVGLAHMEYIQPLVKEGCQNLMLFNKKCGQGH